MPYIIVLIIITVAAGTVLLYRQPAEAPVAVDATPETIETTSEQVVPEGFTPPTTPPPAVTETIEPQDVTAPESHVETETEPEPVAVAPQTFTVNASYFTPRRTEHEMEITIELEGTTIVNTNVTYDGGPALTPNHQAFDGAYSEIVIGQDINEVELSRVGGASLTSTAFNEGIADIRAQL